MTNNIYYERMFLSRKKKKMTNWTTIFWDSNSTYSAAADDYLNTYRNRSSTTTAASTYDDIFGEYNTTGGYIRNIIYDHYTGITDFRVRRYVRQEKRQEDRQEESQEDIQRRQQEQEELRRQQELRSQRELEEELRRQEEIAIARETAKALLMEYLDDNNKEKLNNNNPIEITSRMFHDIIYQIPINKMGNIRAIKENRVIDKLCLIVNAPELPVEDVLLAKILHIRHNEEEMLRIANHNTPEDGENLLERIKIVATP